MRSASFSVFLIDFAAVVLALVIYQLGGRDHFGERGFITFLSTFQLLAIALIADKILQVKKRFGGTYSPPKLWLWRTLSWGFIFLAADEFLSIHEVTDLLIHDLLNLQETNLTDRIDDIIVALYGTGGIWLLWNSRDELKWHPSAIALFKRAFILLFFMVGLDMFANEQDLLKLFFAPSTASTMQRHIEHLEDSFKVFAEAFFILAFYSILRDSKSRAKKLAPVD